MGDTTPNHDSAPHVSHDVFRIDNFSIVRCLLSSHSSVYQYISQEDDQRLKELIPYLTDQITWDNYKANLVSIDSQNKNIALVDELLLDPHYQESLLIVEAITQRYPTYMNLLKQLHQNYNDLKKANEQEQEQEQEKINRDITEIIKALQAQVKNNSELREFLASLAYLKNKSSPQHHHADAEIIESITTVSESLVEIGSTIDEFNESIHERINDLHEISHHAAGETESSAAPEHLTTTGEVVRSIPLVNEFIRGLNCLREAYEAYDDPHTPQRKTKIATSLVAGLASIGTGVVGALLLAGAGLLATTAAVIAAPIVIAAITVGVYAAILYRDAYTLHQARKQAEKAEIELNRIEAAFSREKEITISKHINNLPNQTLLDDTTAIKKIQGDINAARQDLHDAATSKNSDPKMIDTLKHRIHDLSIARNSLIEKNSNLRKNIINDLQLNPRLAQLSMQKSQLTHSIKNLATARSTAKKKTFLSTLCMIGVGLALAAVCATGVGAIALAAVGAAVIVGASIVRVATVIKEKREAAAQKKEPAHTAVPPHTHEYIESSELHIEKRFMHGQQHEIAKALIEERNNAAKRDPVVVKQTQETNNTLPDKNRIEQTVDNPDQQAHITLTHTKR